MPASRARELHYNFVLLVFSGCLMVIAWIGFASIGIFMARFTRVAFGDKELLGTKVWFTVRYDEDHSIFLVFYNSQQKVSPYTTNTQSTEVT